MPINPGDHVAMNNLPDATWFEVVKIEGFRLTVREPGFAVQTIDKSLVKQHRTNAYSSLVAEARERTGHGVLSPIVVSFGEHGEQYAATKRVRGGGIHFRVWLASSRRWAKWRKLDPAKVVRLATPADGSRFAPNYGTAWER